MSIIKYTSSFNVVFCHIYSPIVGTSSDEPNSYLENNVMIRVLKNAAKTGVFTTVVCYGKHDTLMDASIQVLNYMKIFSVMFHVRLVWLICHQWQR